MNTRFRQYWQQLQESLWFVPAKAKAAPVYADEQVGWQPVLSKQTGYLQQINTEELLNWAKRHHVVLRIERPMGAFVGDGTVLFSVAWNDPTQRTLTVQMI